MNMKNLMSVIAAVAASVLFGSQGAAVAGAGHPDLAEPELVHGQTQSQAEVHQYGNEHHAEIRQLDAADSYAAIGQAGTGNEATISQEGAGNVGVITQSGNGNEASVHQDGDLNFGAIAQVGANNEASITQEGVGNFGAVHQMGDANKADVELRGAVNFESIEQRGDGGDVQVTVTPGY